VSIGFGMHFMPCNAARIEKPVPYLVETNMSALIKDAPTDAASYAATVQTITMIWKKLLKLEDFGVNDDFFDLGGNSMLLIAMLELVQNEFRKEIGTEALTDGVSISKMALLLA